MHVFELVPVGVRIDVVVSPHSSPHLVVLPLGVKVSPNHPKRVIFEAVVVFLVDIGGHGRISNPFYALFYFLFGSVEVGRYYLSDKLPVLVL